MCFVCSWNTEFDAMWIAAWLSLCNSVDLLESNPNSWRRSLNQTITLVAEVMARYSVSALDLATTYCFLFFHVTRFPLMNIQNPVLDLRSIGFPSQSASVYPIKSVWPLFFIKIPLPGDPFKYCSTWFTSSILQHFDLQQRLCLVE
jgi:hypothetical protein